MLSFTASPCTISSTCVSENIHIFSLVCIVARFSIIEAGIFWKQKVKSIWKNKVVENYEGAEMGIYGELFDIS